MFKAIAARLKQGHRTMEFPGGLVMPDRFRGLPLPDGSQTREHAPLCPFDALSVEGEVSIDMGRCLFCADCPVPGIDFTSEYRLATSRREDLVVSPSREFHRAEALSKELLSLFGRSLKFREVSAGGCNACEADTNVLSTIGWDLGRYGVQFVASPRHADGIWVTGPVTENMREAMLLTWEAIPSPKIVVACGACAIDGGPFRGSTEIHHGVDTFLPVDLYIPGCPPHPATILDGILRIIGRLV